MTTAIEPAKELVNGARFYLLAFRQRRVAPGQFGKGNARRDDSYIPFDLRWTVNLKDGRRVDVEVYAAPA